MTLNHHQLMIMMRYLIVSLQVLGSCLEPEQAHIDGFLHSMVFYIFDGPDDCDGAGRYDDGRNGDGGGVDGDALRHRYFSGYE